MTPFLQHVADDLRKRFGNDLSHTVVVFPNKRASLFLNEYLMPADGSPVWAPRYITISELFLSFSRFREADEIETICRLYHHFVKATGSNETLDFFYGWGERLLADFDDVDKNRADAARLFRNLSEIKTLEGGELINEEQERVLQEFFRDFSMAGNTTIRTKFLELWNAMYPIYTNLRNELAAAGQAYQGQLYRQVVEELENGHTALPTEIDRYAFVGFNVLNKVEHGLFSFLQRSGRAIFYWDYDTAYTSKGAGNVEAGTFLRRNLKDFPNALPENCFNNLGSIPKVIEFVSSTTENAAATSVRQWVYENLTKDEKRTAVVLCNENLLQPVLHALPENVKEVNVTKGFPLSHTPAYALIEKKAIEILAAVTRDKREKLPSKSCLEECLESLRMHIETEAKTVIQHGGNEKLLSDLYGEAYFLCHTTLTRFANLVDKDLLHVNLPTLFRLIRQVLNRSSIPFHGEPAVGLQIMGVLETRCLDFDNLLLLSVNEGTLPQKVSDNSFIPYDLRREFGLTTSMHKTAVYAYYFYRLIQRASHIRMVYNSSTDGLVQGEMSRFMTQLLVETKLPIRHLSLTATPNPIINRVNEITKPVDLLERVSQLSPSAINTYLRCQLRFFFEYVERLKEPNPPATEIAPNVFGTIFHRTAELIYGKLGEGGKPIHPELLNQILEREDFKILIINKVRQAFKDKKVEQNLIVEEVVYKYITQLLRYDARHNEQGVSVAAPFTIEGLEKETKYELYIPNKGGKHLITLKGNIDRLDSTNLADGLTHIRVIDYKTGGSPEEVKDMEQLFTPAEDHPHYVLQTFLYSLTLLDRTTRPVTPMLFFVHKASKTDYSPLIKFNKEPLLDFRPLAAEFEKHLVNLLAEIINFETSFKATGTPKFCEYCPYSEICSR